jgi:hypothetical protein
MIGHTFGYSTIDRKLTYDKQVMAGLSTLSAILMQLAFTQDRFTIKDARSDRNRDTTTATQS